MQKPSSLSQHPIEAHELSPPPEPPFDDRGGWVTLRGRRYRIERLLDPQREVGDAAGRIVGGFVIYRRGSGSWDVFTGKSVMEVARLWVRACAKAGVEP